MLQISRRADYAVRMMLELALLPEGERLTALQLAERTEVPKAFLHKIVADLTRTGLARTYKGAQGGLALNRSAETISMLDIVEAVDGPVCLNACLLQPAECPRDASCPAHTFWGSLQRTVMTRMKEATLKALLDGPDSISRDEIPYVYW